VDDKHRGLDDPKVDCGLDFETVEFPCGPIQLSGNETLRGWHIPGGSGCCSSKASRSTGSSCCVAICHGGGRDRRQHLRHAAELKKHHPNIGILMFDKQEHGLSDGNGRGIGWFSYEGSDVFAACQYAKDTLDYTKVVAMGTSFGAVGVITAAGHFDPNGQFIDAVIAENPISSRCVFVREIVHSRTNTILPELIRECLAYYICLCMILRRGVTTGVYGIPDPIKLINKISPRPLLIMHGESDTIVPFEHGMVLYDAATNGPKDFLGVPACDHCMVQQTDPEGWRRETSKIIDAVVAAACGHGELTKSY
jgi:pimeloyl-ACP methyl ester carboxylesterase